MRERTQIAWLSAALGLSIGVGLSLWLEASSSVSSFVLPAFLGSLTAFLIAFIAYPWQKQLDRKAEFEVEQRVALRSFLESWYALEFDTRGLKSLGPSYEEQVVLSQRLSELRTQRKKLTYGFLLICSEEDVARVIEMDNAHEDILVELVKLLENWLDDPGVDGLPVEEFEKMVGKSISVWETPHRVNLEQLTNSCRERTPFVEYKTRIGFGEVSPSD